MLLGLHRERIAVNVLGGHTGVVLVGLHETEIGTVAIGETIVAVEEDLGGNNGLITGRLGDRRGCGGGVLPRGLVIGSGAIDREVEKIILGLGLIGTVHPDKLLNGVVKVHAVLLSLGGTSGGLDSLVTGELELLNKHLVGHLGEAAALVGVEVNIVDPERAVTHVDSGGSGSNTGGLEDEVLELLEIDVNLDLVVLEGNEGEGKTGVAVEEEDEGHIVCALSGGLVGGTVVHTNHLLVTGTLLLRHGEVRPDLKPLSVVLVNALTTDLKLNGLHESVTDGVNVADTRATEGGESNLEVHIGDKITIAGNSSGDLTAEIRGTVEGLLNRLNGKVGVAAVDHFEECNLGVPS